MGGGSDSGPRRLINSAAKARLLAGLRAGGSRESAAAGAGFPLKSFYGARRRDPVFRLGWIWALELSAADEQAALRTDADLIARLRRLEDADGLAGAPAGDDAQVRIAPQRQPPAAAPPDALGQVHRQAPANLSSTISPAPPTPRPRPPAAGVTYARSAPIAASIPEFAAAWNEALRRAYRRARGRGGSPAARGAAPPRGQSRADRRDGRRSSSG